MPQLVSGMKNNWPKPQWRITSAIFSGKKNPLLKIQSKQTIFEQKLQKQLNLCFGIHKLLLNTFGSKLWLIHFHLTRIFDPFWNIHFLEIFVYIWISVNTFNNRWIHFTIFGYKLLLPWVMLWKLCVHANCRYFIHYSCDYYRTH